LRAEIKTLPIEGGEQNAGRAEIKTLPLPLPVEGGEQNAGRAEKNSEGKLGFLLAKSYL